MIDQVNKQIANAPETIFDTFPIKIDARGGAIREELTQLISLFGTINKLATNALFLYEQAKTRKERVEALAWEKVVDLKYKVTQQKIMVREVEVVIDGEVTCLRAESERVALYSYVSTRGKDKVKEMESAIDIGRSLISWDKMAAERGM